MQDINNDTDDLLRKAAEQYPLKADGAAWQKVLALLQDDTSAATPAMINDDNKEKRKKRVLWLLWLLPLGLLYAVWYSNSSAVNKQVAGNKENVQKKKAGNGNENTNNNEITAAKPSLHTEKKELSINHKIEQKEVKSSVATKANDVAKNSDQHAAYSFNNTGVQSTQKQKDNLPVFPPTTNHQLSTINHQPSTNTSNEIADDKKIVSEKQPGESPNRIQNTIAEDNKKESEKDVVAKQNVSDSSNALSVNKKDSAVANSEAAGDKKDTKIKAKTQRQQGFYAGLLGSFDISTVKWQRVNKTGYGLQVLAGYRFSKRLSVETGLSLSKKNYYSNGKYFDKTKTGIPDPVKIYFTNGDCKMFDVPLNVKYDFVLHKKSNLFAVAGLSSYFMKKEDYSYHASWGTWVYDTSKHYTNSGANWFSVANISIGYQWQINRHSTLRIEPYVKLPLHGIGIANMPIMSTGISVGFTKKF